MAGLFDNPNFYGSLAALGALGRSMQPSPVPRNDLASLLEVAGAFGQGRLGAGVALDQNRLQREKQNLAQAQAARINQALKNATPQERQAYMLGGPAGYQALQQSQRNQALMRSLFPTTQTPAAGPMASATGMRASAAPGGLAPVPPAAPAIASTLPAGPPAVRPFADRVSRQDALLAMQTKDPATALLKLGATGRNPLSIPEKFNERLEYWRKDLKPYVKDLEGYAQKLSIVEASLKQGTGAGDIAAVQQYQRMIDDAVVRGEDIQLISSAQGLAQRLLQRVEQAKTGAIYDPTLRADIARAALTFSEQVRSNRMGRLQGMKGMADPAIQRVWDTRILGQDLLDRYGSPFSIGTTAADYPHRKRGGSTVRIPAPGSTASPANTPKAPPRKGEIREGYRYRGGDPSKQSSWQKVE